MRDAERHRMFSNLARAMRGIIPQREKTWIDQSNIYNNCIFCGGSPTNLQHIWPRWSHDFLSKGSKSHWIRLAVQRPRASFIRYFKKPGDMYDRQVKAVDERCNNGWMRNVVEDAARPIITKLATRDPSLTRITEQDQFFIARYIAMQSIVAEYDRGAPRITHHMQRKFLFEKHSISKKHWLIWIGNYADRKAKTIWHEYPCLILPQARVERRQNRVGTYVNSQVLTYVIGDLLIHCIHTPDPLVVRRWRIPDPVGSKLRVIWPPTGYSITWPIPTLTDNEAFFAAMAFRTYITGIMVSLGVL